MYRNDRPYVRWQTRLVFFWALAILLPIAVVRADVLHTEANRVVELTFTAARSYSDPFKQVTLGAVITRPDGARKTVPAFWAGGGIWKIRYASSLPGIHKYRTEGNDSSDAGLNGIAGEIEISPNSGANPLYRHGPVQVAPDHRHFEHVDGTPFFWLGDTWWKGLCGRIPFAGFQELAADRRAKGFTVVQIVAGPLPDEPPFDPRWANEGGMPYQPAYAEVNPAYFAAVDRRMETLLDAGLVPAIVGGWGWHMPAVGVEKMDRHWRYLVARYGAYPVVWVVGGEAGGPAWTTVAHHLRDLDPFHRLATVHPYNSARQSLTDETALDFDMLQTGHGGGWGAPLGDYAGVALNTVAKITSHYSKTPVMPVLVGEVTYEGHMMSNGAEIQRFMFWSTLLNGAAGHTYGAGGIWQMNSATERGAEYEFTPWSEAMRLPGSTQVGLGKKLLEEYPWWRFEPHPEWVGSPESTLLTSHPDWYEDNLEFTARGGKWDRPSAAGIPGEVRVVYQPGHYYNWTPPTIQHLERDLPYHAFLFDPATGMRFSLGTVINTGPPPQPFAGHTQPMIFSDDFTNGVNTAWKDYGTPTHRQDGRLVGGKGLVTVLETNSEPDLMASVDANADAEAGIILRFHDADDYLVALYSPSLKAIFLHDRQGGHWGEALGRVDVPEIGKRIHLTAAACGEYTALVLTDGQRSYHTPSVPVHNTLPGKAGLWLFQIGDHQEFGHFQLSRTGFSPVKRDTINLPAPLAASTARELPLIMHENPNIVPAVKIPEVTYLSTDEYTPPRLPAPQDWVLVLERLKPSTETKR